MDLAENFYAAGNGGVFKSTNDGTSFTNFNFTYSANQIICFQNKILVAASGTSNGGVYIYSDSLVGVKEIYNSVPDKFTLHQNYPNPFNPETVISYDLPYTSGAVLEVFDVNGKLISLLVNEKQTSGTHKVKWDGSEYPSGVYFYKLTADQYSDTRKMVLIK